MHLRKSCAAEIQTTDFRFFTVRIARRISRFRSLASRELAHPAQTADQKTSAIAC